jgi:predicted 3-demethylubiquinone-9 3-methyltransferase (glyoxalase superfamily)
MLRGEKIKGISIFISITEVKDFETVWGGNQQGRQSERRGWRKDKHDQSTSYTFMKIA